MESCPDHQSDAVILSMFERNNKLVWEHLYNKYASMLYGIIIHLVNDEKVAGDLLTDVFVEVKAKKVLSRIRTSLCHTLIRLTYVLTVKYLKERELKYGSASPLKSNSLHVHLLFQQLSDLNESVSKSLVTKKEILENLRLEFNQFRIIGKFQPIP